MKKLAERNAYEDDRAEACRSALLDFLSTQAASWSKADLAAWLSGPYREATRGAPGSMPRQPHEVLPYSQVSTQWSSRLAEDRVRDVAEYARRLVRTALSAATKGDGAFAWSALDDGDIVELIDGSGASTWSPVDHPHMQLANRVFSLLAADFMMRPGDYASCIVCEVCEAVSFDEDAHGRGTCRVHASGIQSRVRRCSTMPGVGPCSASASALAANLGIRLLVPLQVPRPSPRR